MQRLANNPLLTPSDLQPTRDDLTVMCTLNPAAVRFGDETLLLVRVGESGPRSEKYLPVVTYDASKGSTEVHRIDLKDPDLDFRDPRKVVYRGKTLLTSMSHLRIARSRDGINFTFDPTPAIYPANKYEAFGCEDARITLIEGVYYIAYTAVSEYLSLIHI